MADLFEQFQPAPQPKSLRPHQAKAIELIRLSLARGSKRVVLEAATGFGKTLTAAKIIEGALAKGNRVIFTAPAVSLINQTVAAFEAEGIRDIGVMQANHPRTDALARVQVCSVQTLARREIPEAALVIVDECHIRAKVIEDLMDEREDVFFVGLTATPGAKGMGLRWQELVTPCTIGELIEAGFLSRFTAFAPDVPDLRGVKTVAGDYAEDQLAKIMGDNALMASVVQTWLAKGENRPTLLFGVDCAHAKAMAHAFEAAGVATAYVDAYTDVVERELIATRFKSGEVKIACSVRTLTTGIDWPVSCIIDAAPTKSLMLHVQKIGRGLRVNPGTEDLLILDHAGNSLRNGLVTDIEWGTLDATRPGERQKPKEAERLPKPCGHCATLFTGTVCPACGTARRSYSGVTEAEGELVEITGAKAKTIKADRDEKQRVYSMALWMANERGYKEGWAANKYKEKFGVWPRGLSRIPAAPDQAFLNWEKSRRIAWAKRKQKEARA